MKLTYDYLDENGALLFQVVRQEPGRDGQRKSIYQRQPTGKDGWINNLKGVRLVPYRLPEVLKQDKNRLLFVVEGEKCADALWDIDVAATTNPQGAGKWRAEYSEHLRGRNIIVLPDNDEPGHRHAEDVAKHLSGIAARVQVLELPDLPPKGDIVDWLAAGGDKDKLLKLVADLPRVAASKPSQNGVAGAGATSGESPTKKSAATRLVKLVLDSDAELFHNPEQVAYATIPSGNHAETLAVRSAGCKRWLGRVLYEAEGRAPGGQALQDAINLLESKACFDGAERAVHVRLAEHDGKFYFDLADKEWRVIEIDAAGWRIVADAPVRFRRPKGLLPLPEPQRDGSVEDLRPFVNVADDGDWRLLLAWLLAALRPSGPYPLLVLSGQQGSAKSTVSRLLRSLIDPNKSALRSEPKEPRDLMIAATNGWLLCLDNLSFLPPWLSDAMCRLATGGGFSTRELFTDSEEMIFDAMRPLLVNGIEDLATRGDLLDRAVLLTLPTISEDKRRSERKLWRDFERARPRILGALLTALSKALGELPKVKLSRLPRMADFAEWAVAVETALGWPPGSFLNAYGENRHHANQTALEASPIAGVLIHFMEGREDWTGTASELLPELTAFAGDPVAKGQDWPKRANTLGGWLNRLAPNLRAVGITVERGVGRNRRRIAIKTTRGESASPSSPSSPCQENKGFSSDNGATENRHRCRNHRHGDNGDDPRDGPVTIPAARNGLKNKPGDDGDSRDDESRNFSYLAPGLSENGALTPFDEENKS
ncbi:MAG: hypothetical protein ACYC3I_15285 [Gemmataceae bacterium]